MEILTNKQGNSQVNAVVFLDLRSAKEPVYDEGVKQVGTIS